MNQAIKLSAVLVLGLLAVLVRPAEAQSVTDRLAAVCTNVETRWQSVDRSLTDLQQQLSDRSGEFTDTADNRRGELDDELNQLHKKIDNRYKLWYDTAKDDAETDKEKAAVETFYTELQRLVGVRRQAFQDARTTFRQEVDTLRGQRLQATNSRVDQLRSATDSAFASAQDACDGQRLELANIRKDFVENLKNARLEYASFRRDSGTYRDQIATAINTRNQSMRDALRLFEQGFQQALSDFRSASE